MTGRSNPLLKIRDLTIAVGPSDRPLRLVERASLEVHSGQTLGIVGESGSGKSMTALAIMGLLPPNTRVIEGGIEFDGVELTRLTQSQMRSFRGGQIGMILQDPMSSLDPLFSIGLQLDEALAVHETGMDRRGREARTVELLDQVRISDAARRAKQYPHELSGGMRQRAVGAIGLAGRPKLIIADEPTTALDVTIQAQYLDLLKRIQTEDGVSLVVISHDFGVIASVADAVAVMYSGTIVEYGPARDILSAPRHPYTRGLMESVPRLGQRRSRLYSIPGAPPDPARRPSGCAFRPRCAKAGPNCHSVPPIVHDADRMVRCWHPEGSRP